MMAANLISFDINLVLSGGAQENIKPAPTAEVLPPLPSGISRFSD